MRDITSVANTAARRAKDAPNNWVETLARLGYVTIGVVHLIIGVLATQAAIGAGGAPEGTQGALHEIARQPFGRILLGVTAIGLAGYVIWRFVQALFDPERQGTHAKGIIVRLGCAISGATYAALAVLAARMALGMGGGGGGNSEQELTAQLLAQPFGQLLVGIVGGIIIGVGLAHFFQAYTAKFMQEYATGEMSRRQRRWVRRLGQFGLAARGVTFCIIGGFLIYAGIAADPTEARGLGGALAALAQQAYGPWLLGVVALGLVAYGIFCMSQALYRRVVTS
jgi:hypothetical protein